MDYGIRSRYGKIKNNIELINNIDFCVVNGGYSALSELYWAKIPMIVVPVPNHAEQWTNAKQIELSGTGIISDKDNYEKKITELNKDFKKFEDNYDKNVIDNCCVCFFSKSLIFKKIIFLTQYYFLLNLQKIFH